MPPQSLASPACDITGKGLVTNYGEGGLQNGRGRGREVLPLRKGGGGGKSLTMLKGGAQQVLGYFYAVA